MSGALPITAVPPQALPGEHDSLLTLRAAPKTHVNRGAALSKLCLQALYTNFNLDLPSRQDRLDLRAQRLRQVDADEHDRGLVPLDAGEILFDGKSLKDTQIGYVFQNYRDALFPWISASDNIAYPLKRQGAHAEAKCAGGELVRLFEIRFDLARYPYELSGGQMQTVCIMRSLATRPEVLFLDEPFSALDFEMTLFIRAKLQEAHVATGTTMVIVSHDLEGRGVPGRSASCCSRGGHAHRRAG
jgi:NitT/TauT family transport system ATP-binding protein